MAGGERGSARIGELEGEGESLGMGLEDGGGGAVGEAPKLRMGDGAS